MAIPIRNYIEIKTRLTSAVVGERDFSGMVFTEGDMLETVPTEYASIKTRYNSGLPVALDSAGVLACFGSSSDESSFAATYFGYSGGTRTPSILNFCKILDSESETAKTAYDRCINDTVNFGAFTFLGDISLGTASSGGILEVALANDGSDAMLQLVVATDSTNVSSYATALKDLQMTHLVVSTPESSATNLGAAPVVAWYAAVNYNAAGSSGTIDYKQFAGLPAEVKTQATKSSYDSLHANYIGEVKTYGSTIAFYQTGVNMNGVDMGTMRDAAWIKGQIETGYFNLQLSVQKLSADRAGEAKVTNLVVGVANRAIGNGCILVDKPLSNAQIAAINSYAETDMAADEVQSTGYFVDTKIVQVGDKYHVQYTLIYGKGDHIVKVDGTHIVV